MLLYNYLCYYLYYSLTSATIPSPARIPCIRCSDSLTLYAPFVLILRRGKPSPRSNRLRRFPLPLLRGYPATPRIKDILYKRNLPLYDNKLGFPYVSIQPFLYYYYLMVSHLFLFVHTQCYSLHAQFLIIQYSMKY